MKYTCSVYSQGLGSHFRDLDKFLLSKNNFTGCPDGGVFEQKLPVIVHIIFLFPYYKHALI
jgi:hypothetical protein